MASAPDEAQVFHVLVKITIVDALDVAVSRRSWYHHGSGDGHDLRFWKPVRLGLANRRMRRSGLHPKRGSPPTTRR